MSGKVEAKWNSVDSSALSLVATGLRPLLIVFHGADQSQLGCLYEEDGELKFEGEVHESAKMFFEHVVELNSLALKKAKQGSKE